jgi:hypothetical protein
MAREWMQYPSDIEVPTAFGPVWISITDAKHVYVDANSNGRALTYRGKRYSVSFHFNLYDDLPSFQVSRDPNGQPSRTAVYGDVPPSYKTKITEAVLLEVNAYLRAHSDLLRKAEIASANNEVARAEEKLEEAERAAEAARCAYGLALDRYERALKLPK